MLSYYDEKIDQHASIMSSSRIHLSIFFRRKDSLIDI